MILITTTHTDVRMNQVALETKQGRHIFDNNFDYCP